MSSYRAAVIGLGRIGSTFDDEQLRGGNIFTPFCHGPAYYHSPLVDLVAAADLHAEQRSLFGKRWGISAEHLYSDYNEMLLEENLDIVSVCTTARYRSQIVQDVAKSGAKVIWTEKPISLSLSEADEMLRTCREKDVKLAINCGRRWHPVFNEAKQMIDAGDLGDILQVTGYGSCKLSHNGSHLLDIMHYMAGGKVEWLFAEMESDEKAAGDDDLSGNAYLAFNNGVRGYVRSTDCGAADWEIDVIGKKGRIRSMGNGEWDLVRLVSSDHGIQSTRPFSSHQSDKELQVRYPFPLPSRIQGTGLNIVEDLVSCIDNNHNPRCSGEDGRAALEVAIAMRESHRRGGEKIILPIEDRSLQIRSLDIDGDTVPRRIRDIP